MSEVELGYKGNLKSLLAMHGYLEPEKALKCIKYKVDNEVIDIERVNKTSEKGLLYIMSNGEVLKGAGESEEKLATFKFVPIGYYDKHTGNPLCASFIKTSFGWEGIYVGTVVSLLRRIIEDYKKRHKSCNVNEDLSLYDGYFDVKGFGLEEVLRYNKKDLGQANISNENLKKLKEIKNNLEKEKEEEKEDGLAAGSDEIYNEIYDRLLMKENWFTGDVNRLQIYIKSLIEKIAYDQKENKDLVGNGYVLSKERDKCLFNTGLIDKFNNDIYLIDLDNNKTKFTNKRLIIVNSKSSLINYGFNREDILEMPKPIRFYKDKSELIFNANINEFDLQDNHSLYHIINERRDRFPEKYRDIPAGVLGEKIKLSIRTSVRIAERDYKYIVPMYSFSHNKIQYLMPLHLDTSIDDVPELALVVGETNGFYKVYTILNLEDAYNNARLLCRPDSNWLKVAEK